MADGQIVEGDSIAVEEEEAALGLPRVKDDRDQIGGDHPIVGVLVGEDKPTIADLSAADDPDRSGWREPSLPGLVVQPGPGLRREMACRKLYESRLMVIMAPPLTQRCDATPPGKRPAIRAADRRSCS